MDPRDLDRLRSLGAVVQESRMGRLSLTQLAAHAEISVEQLKQVENGSGNPTLEVIGRIARALELDVTDLIEGRPDAPTIIVRKNERRRYKVVGVDHEIHLLTPGIHRQLTVEQSVCPPGERQKTVLHRGFQLFYVLSGTLTVEKDGGTYHIGPDDSLFCSVPFTFGNDGDETVEYLAVFRPDSNEDSGDGIPEDDVAGAESADVNDHTTQPLVGLIGQRIRRLRRDKFTLLALARASRLSVGLLSKIENGAANPSFASLNAVARALDVDIHRLIAPEDDRPVLTSRSNRIHLQSADKEVEIKLLVPDTSLQLMAFLATLPPGYEMPRPVRAHSAQQLELVLRGSVEISIEQEVHQLQAGDAILFDAGRPHSRRNLDPLEPVCLFTASREVQITSFLPPEQ
jgi:transcriptional regulator with XRE-family HTH domain